MWRILPSVVKARIVNKGRCANSPFPHLIKMKLMIIFIMMVMIMTIVVVMIVQMRNIHITLVAAQRKVVTATFSEIIKFSFGFSMIANCAF